MRWHSTSVIDLRIETFLGVMAGIGRTHGFARRGVALLAQNRSELHADIGEFALVVPLHPNPVHGPAARSLDRSHCGNIVFGAAGCDARFAAGATVQINSHSPSMCHIVSFVYL